jgi:hypothetical protein
VIGADGTDFGGTGRGALGRGVTGGGVTGRGVVTFGRGVASGSGLGRGFGVISGSGFGVAGRGVVGLGVEGFGVEGFGVAGSGVIAGRTGFGFGRGVAPGCGVAGTVLISSRAFRKARFFCSSLIAPLCCARRAALPTSRHTIGSNRIFRTRRMLLVGA